MNFLSPWFLEFEVFWSQDTWPSMLSNPSPMPWLRLAWFEEKERRSSLFFFFFLFFFPTVFFLLLFLFSLFDFSQICSRYCYFHPLWCLILTFLFHFCWMNWNWKKKIRIQKSKKFKTFFSSIFPFFNFLQCSFCLSWMILCRIDCGFCNFVLNSIWF